MPFIDKIDDCRAWVLKGERNPLWPKRVEKQFLRLKKELGYEYVRDVFNEYAKLRELNLN